MEVFALLGRMAAGAWVYGCTVSKPKQPHLFAINPYRMQRSGQSVKPYTTRISSRGTPFGQVSPSCSLHSILVWILLQIGGAIFGLADRTAIYPCAGRHTPKGRKQKAAKQKEPRQAEKASFAQKK